MSTDEVLALLAERGLSVRLSPDGTPHLLGPKSEKTQKLLRVLWYHRGEIVERLKPKPKPPIVYWRLETGVVLVGLPGASSGTEARYGSCVPLGAAGWRTHPEDEWQDLDALPPEWGIRAPSPVPAAQPDALPAPEEF